MLLQARCSPSLRRRVHTAAERTHASTEDADTDVAPIQKFSCRKYMCNGRDRGSPTDLVWDTHSGYTRQWSRHAGANGSTTWQDASSHVSRRCRWKHYSCCPRGEEARWTWRCRHLGKGRTAHSEKQRWNYGSKKVTVNGRRRVAVRGKA